MNIPNLKIKSTAGLLIISFFFALLSVYPTKAEALIPSVDPSSAALMTKEFTLDPIVWVIVKLIAKKVISSTTKWVDSGFEGAPLFARDPAGFLTGVGDSIFGDFIRSSGFDSLCSPFKLQVQGAILAQYRNSRIGPREEYQSACKFSTIAGNVQQFIGGDFAQGGWPGWLALTQDKQGNPYSAVMDASAQGSIRISGTKNIELAKLNWANGFIDSAACKRKDSNGKCIERGQTKTPGSVIASKLNLGLGSDIRTLEISDELSELLGTLLNTVIGKVFTGAKGLFSGNGTGTNYGDTGLDDGGIGGAIPTQLTVTLLGPDPQTVSLNQPYLEYGAYATDPTDGNIPADAITISGDVDVTLAGTYILTYSAINSAGQTAQTTRTVNVVDPAAPPTPSCRGGIFNAIMCRPVITLIGPTTVFVTLNSTDPTQRVYTEPGYTARAADGSDITNLVSTSTRPFILGGTRSYIIDYNVTDATTTLSAVKKSRTVWFR